MRIAPNIFKLIRIAIYVLVLISLIASGSCTSRNNKTESRNLIPEKDLVAILTDAYIAGGLLANPQIHNMFNSLDTIEAYCQVIEKHGYTKETMDKTIKYYYVKKPKELISIYDQVLGILSEMESRIEKEVLIESSRIDNLWNGEESYFYPGSMDSDSAGFDLSIIKSGNYVLSFTLTLFADDQTLNPHFNAFYCNSDSLETGKKNLLETLDFIKDGQPHTYTINVSVPEKKQLHFKGFLFDYDNHPDSWDKHLLIEKISFVYTSMTIA